MTDERSGPGGAGSPGEAGAPGAEDVREPRAVAAPGRPPVTAPGDPGPSEPAPPEVRRAQEERLAAAWKTPEGWRYWSAVNNSEVGMWYVGGSALFFLFGGVLALLMRVQLAVPENDFIGPELYNQLFTLHGSVMMFLFAVPVFEAIAVYLLPEMLGARDLPFPRLSAYGFWCFLIGGVFVAGSIFFGAAPAGGWFMYPPLTTSGQPGIGADIWLLGLSFIEIASIAAAVELIVGVLKCRPVGMRINLMPLYAWYVLVVAVMILFAFPPLIAGDVLLELERAFDWPFFDPSRGGDPLLWQHLFWIFGHPEVYIVFLPSTALIATMLPVLVQRRMIGHTWIVLAAVGTGFLSFGLWVHHMYTTGLPGVSLGFFSAASEAVAIPTGIQIFCFIATLMLGRATKSVPMLFVLGGLATFVIGGLTGVMVALAPFDFQVHDTYFVVGHLHYVLIGGTIFPILAGIHYYAPLVIHRTLSERLGRISFWTIFVGFNVTFLPMHLTGLQGMARRIFTYPDLPGLAGLNMVSSAGAFVIAAGFVPLLWDVVRPKGKEPRCERNPWNAGTLEWTARIPGMPWGIRSVPEVDSRYPLWDQEDFVQNVDDGLFYLNDAEEGLRETMVTTVVDARPLQVQRVAGPSWLPLIAAALSGGAFVAATYHAWWPALAFAVGATGVILGWLWTGTAIVPEKGLKDVGRGLELPTYASGPASVGWWAMFVTMTASATAFVSLVFGYFFYWTVHEDFPPDPAAGPGVLWPLLGAVLVLGGWGATWTARRLNARGSSAVVVLGALAGGALAAGLGGAALVAGPWSAGMDPTSHVHPAIVWALVGWVVVHVGLGMLMSLYCAARVVAGRITAVHDMDLHNVTLFWHFVALETVVAVAVVAGFPWLA